MTTGAGETLGAGLAVRVVQAVDDLLGISYILLVLFGGRIPQLLFLVVLPQALWQAVIGAWLRLYKLTSAAQLPRSVRLVESLIRVITLAVMAAIVVRFYR